MDNDYDNEDIIIHKETKMHNKCVLNKICSGRIIIISVGNFTHEICDKCGDIINTYGTV